MTGFDPAEDLAKNRAGAWNPPHEWFVPGPVASHVMACLSEGFCPRCSVSLVGITENKKLVWYCPSCIYQWKHRQVTGQGGVSARGWEGTYKRPDATSSISWYGCPEMWEGHWDNANAGAVIDLGSA